MTEKPNAEMLADIVKDCREAAKIRREQNNHPLSALDVAGIYERIADSIERAAAPSPHPRREDLIGALLFAKWSMEASGWPEHPADDIEWDDWLLDKPMNAVGLRKANFVEEAGILLAELPESIAAPPPAGADAMIIPVGWKLVPLRATEVQMDAGLYQSSADSTSADVYSIYADMIDAAPSPDDHPDKAKPARAPQPQRSDLVREALRRSHGEEMARLGELQADESIDAVSRNWQGGKVAGISTAIMILNSLLPTSQPQEKPDGALHTGQEKS